MHTESYWRVAAPHITHHFQLIRRLQRCWHDAEDIAPSEDDPLTRPLERGEVGVSFLSNNGRREILPESDLSLIDRTFQPGDYCKRSIDDVRSAVVLSIKVRGKLEHAITNAPVDGWRESSEVVPAMEAEARDYVLCDDWIGQVRPDPCLEHALRS